MAKKLPKAVREAEKKAEELQLSLQTPQEPIIEPPVEPGIEKPPVAAPIPEPVKEPTPEEYKDKYTTLQGKYDAEIKNVVPGLVDEITSRNARIAELESQITKPVVEPVIDDEPVELGQMRNELPGVLKSLEYLVDQKVKEKVTPLGNKVTDIEVNTAESARASFHQALLTACPEWRTLNKDAGFLNWSNGEAPYTGRTKLDILREAFASGDSVTSANIFNGYKTEVLKVDVPVVNVPVPNINTVLHPPKGTTVPVAPQAEVKMISRKFINDFYTNKVKGKYTVKEAEEIEKQIEYASTHGGVQ